MASFLNRINIEIHEKTQKNTNILESCLNSFLLICEDDYVLEYFLPEIEGNIAPLLGILYNPQCSDSYDVILLIFYRVMQEKKTVPAYLLMDLKLFNVIFANSKYSFGNLFQVINQFLILGKEFIASNLIVLEEVFN
jgi:hypothetical protein